MLGASVANVRFNETFDRFWTGCKDIVFNLDSSLFCVTTEGILNKHRADGSVVRFLFEAIFVCY